jgi:hypothetical protein
LEASSDAGYDSLAELLEAWHACYGETPTTLKMVFRHLTMYAEESAYQRLQEAIDGFCHSKGTTTFLQKASMSVVLGKHLKKVERRIINGKRMEKQPDRGKDGFSWTVRVIGQVV